MIDSELIYCQNQVRQIYKKMKTGQITFLAHLFKEILDIHGPRKQKYARGNHMPSMNKALSKDIMTRAQYRNRLLKDRIEENKE